MSNPNIASRFDEIYSSTKKAVLTLVTAKCGNTADISDIIQETYMELYMVLRKRGADYVTNEKAFVMKLAKQKIARHYSLMDRLRVFISFAPADEDGQGVELSDVDVNGFLMEDFAINSSLLETARQFIVSKPEVVKKVFYLFYDLGLSIPEIGQTLSLSESNVKNKLYRTLKELRDVLQ